MNQQDFVRRLQQPGYGVYAFRNWERVHWDMPLFLLLLALAGTGLFALHSASGGSEFYVKRQAVWLGIGFAAMFVMAQISPRFLARWALLPWLGGVVLLLAVAFFGTGVKGGQRWLDLGGFRFQPSEVLKIVVPLMLASYLGRRHLPPRFKHAAISLVLIAVPAGLVVVQPDLGTSLLVIMSGFFVLFLAGLPQRYLVIAAICVAVAIPLMWIYGMHDYQRQRVLTLLDPQSDKLGAGWNIVQSTTAIGSGGLEGKGWMQGTQSQLDFLPESHTDFIIAVLAEEFGLLGVLLLLALYCLIIGRGLLISLGAANTFGRLLAGGITLTFSVCVFVNMGMASGILPVVGVPLPLMSYGGTSAVTLMLGFGMLMAIQTEKKRDVYTGAGV